MENFCEKCWYNAYDEDSDEYFCDLQLDEDEYVRLMQEKTGVVSIFALIGANMKSSGGRINETKISIQSYGGSFCCVAGYYILYSCFYK